jgi:hypothetical protein
MVKNKKISKTIKKKHLSVSSSEKEVVPNLKGKGKRSANTSKVPKLKNIVKVESIDKDT